MLLYLTGYRGTGKTSVGRLVAEARSLKLIDLDVVIEENAGKTIAEIFAAGGESLFRELETEALQSVSGEDQAVISLGGGAVISETNRGIIKFAGLCFWLQASATTIASRILDDETSATRRPSLTGLSPTEEIAQLLAARNDWYADVATYRIETEGKSMNEVAADILSHCPKTLRPHEKKR